LIGLHVSKFEGFKVRKLEGLKSPTL